MYDLESKHHKKFDEYVDQANLQSLAIVDLTKKVDDMMIDRDGVVEVTRYDPGFTAAEAGPAAAAMLHEHAATLVQEEPRTYEVRGMGWILD